jgi:NAD(P)-dependent dehydrogenase (short-subunit alcohol dehydrogenase family)
VPELDGQVVLVTGGGRGIGAGIARELASAGMSVAVSGRTEAQVNETAEQIGGLALVGDVSEGDDVDRWVREVESKLGPIDLLVNNAGIGGEDRPAWEAEPEEWWRTFEINVRGPFLTCRAVLPGMIDRGRGRVVNVASGAASLPVGGGLRLSSSYGASKAALYRFSEILAAQLHGNGISVFPISPGLVKTEMTKSAPADSPWTPPECAPVLVRALASGRFDRLSGRYLHAEHDPPDELESRIEQVLADDLNAIRLRR